MNKNYDEIDNLILEYFEKNQEVPDLITNGINSAIKNKNKKYKIVLVIRKIVITIISLITLTGGVVFAKDFGNFIKNIFGPNTSDGVDIAVNNGYILDVNTEYQTAEGIEIKVDSMLMDDFNFDMNFNVILSEKYDFDEIDFEDLKIVDETGKIVFNTHIPEFETEEMKEKIYKGGYSLLSTKTFENQFNVSLSATGNSEPFPKSKHLIVTFSKIKTCKYNNLEKINELYEGNWKFEIDVPEEFYNRDTIIYKAKSCNDKEFNLNEIEATLSNTAFKIYIPTTSTKKIEYKYFHADKFGKINFSKLKDAIHDEYVENSEGKIFATSQRSDGDGGYSIPQGENKMVNYHQSFNFTKYDATNEITVHMFTNKDKEIIIKFERNL